MGTRPRIGITVESGKEDVSRSDYSAAVTRAGGVPVFLRTQDAAQCEKLVAMIDGLLLPGGGDLDPALYDQPKHPEAKLLNPADQQFAMKILQLAESRGTPILGICLGCQMMNVSRGGTLHQHLPDVPIRNLLEHSRPKKCLDAHDVTLHPGTLLARQLQCETLTVNSRHHQAIDALGHGLRVTALAPDGIIEAIEDPARPFWIAVQWHPENLPSAPHDRLFTALAEAAANDGARSPSTAPVIAAP